ncbi:MAG: SGNH/GDSL hydrolase family protein [Planctomycetes bacterium]|nr:SGNH/GDSL hydrolase family protein [Planctomycetota bacterium]
MPSSIRTRLALVLGGALLATAAVEVAVRVRQKLRFGGTGFFPVETRFDEQRQLVLLEPNQDTGRIRINSLGFRSPELESPKPRGRARLAFIGGSTTLCIEVAGDENTWPHLTWQRIQQSELLQKTASGASVDYVNGGVHGYGLVQTARHFHDFVEPQKPDVVLIYHATNDLTGDTRELARKQGLFEEDPNAQGGLARYSLTWFLIQKNLKVKQRTTRNGNRKTLQFDPASTAKPFGDRLARFCKELRERTGALVAVTTFSQRARIDQTPEQQLDGCESSLVYMPWMSPAQIAQSFAIYNEEIRRAARETGALLIEAEREIPADKVHFVDSVHLSQRGCDRMADIHVRALLGWPQFCGLMEALAREAAGK